MNEDGELYLESLDGDSESLLTKNGGGEVVIRLIFEEKLSYIWRNLRPWGTEEVIMLPLVYEDADSGKTYEGTIKMIYNANFNKDE